MKSGRRKSLLILVIALVAALMPLQAFAADTTTSGTADNAAAAEEVKNGVVIEKGVPKYYVKGSLKEFTGWKKIDGEKYYGLGDGTLAHSATAIKTKTKVTKKVKGKKVTKTVTTYPLYMFRKNGKLITKKGLYKYKDKEYYGNGDGSLKTGWVAFKEKKKDKAAYFNEKNGAMKKGGKVKYLEIPENGRLGEAYALGIKKLDSTKWTLKQAYKNSYRLKYYDRWWRQSSSEKYALRGFKRGKGNCYVMAATFYIQAKLLGYDVHQVKGKVAYRYPHSWTVIKQGGKEWVYDPNFKNETGRNGWKIWYGKRGTWKYTKYKKMN